MSVKNINILLRNNTGNKDKATLVEGFVVRTKIFKTIFDEIRNSISDKPEQSYLVIGQRGAGKTTLLHRLKYAIEDDSYLNKHLIPVIFGEEQYHITELVNLWESVGDYLEDWQKWEGISEAIEEKITNSKFPEEAALEVLVTTIKRKEKKIILFIENINVFFKKIGEKGQKRLREILITSDCIRLVGTSTSYFDGIIDYSKPFYDFFKIIHLDSLDAEECKTLLLKIGEQYGEAEAIKKIIENNPNRIESLRRLTGGVPRTISYLFQIFLDNEDGKAIKDLYQLIDTLSFLYKAELDQLSPQQQKVLDVIARNWEAIAVKDIVKNTRYDSKNISSILNTLEKNELVEIVATHTKNNLYLIKERFMNIWYLLRFGRKHDKENILWLVRFYDVWCDTGELKKRIATHIRNLKDGKYDITAAIDMGNTFLACENVSEDLKYSIYETTKNYLPRHLINSLKLSDQTLYEKINEFFKNKEFNKVENLINQIKEKNQKYHEVVAFAAFRNKDYAKSEAASEKVYSYTQDAHTAVRIAFLNKTYLNNLNKAEEYLMIALDKKDYRAAEMLVEIFIEKDDLDNARKYCEIAVQNGHKESIIVLGSYYHNLGMLHDAELLYLQAIKKNLPEAISKLGQIYQEQKNHNKAIALYEDAIKKGIDEAILLLGTLYLEKPHPNVSKAKKYFMLGIEKDMSKAYFLMGELYLEKLNNEEEAIIYLKQAVDKGSADAAHSLGHIYEYREMIDESNKYFAKSIKLGRQNTMFCLARTSFFEKRNNNKEFVLEIMQQNIPLEKGELGPKGKLEYAIILLWNDEIEKSLAIFKDTFPSLKEVFNKQYERPIEIVISDLSEYFIFLIAKGQYKAAHSLFENEKTIDFKQVLKPVYYALMNYMKKDFPNEYLKAGKELKESVDEIIETIETMKKEYH